MSDKTEDSVLVPPMQSDRDSLLLCMHGLAAPNYRFAVAEVTDEPQARIRVSLAIPAVCQDQARDDESTYIENVEQTYTTSVPYSETVNGQQVFRSRVETRTRFVPVRRRKNSNQNASTGKPLVPRSITISVPFTEHVPLADGSVVAVMRTRQETRTTMVDPDEPAPVLIPKIISNHFPLKQTRCFTTTGVELDESEKRNRLKCPIPVLLSGGTEQIAPYFGRFLNPDTLIILDPTESVSLRDER